MKLIKPSQISGEIMTLIEEADVMLIIISPYYNLDKWKKFLNVIDYLKKKEIEVEFFVRKGEYRSIEQVKKIGYNPIEFANLHTKLYLNEKYAIVSSMNLTQYSDTNSLDIAYKTETRKEYNELLEYYERYLKIEKSNKIKSNKSSNYFKISNGRWVEYIETSLKGNLNVKIRSKIEDNTLIINGSNLYYIHISESKQQHGVNIEGIISRDETDALEILKEKFESKSRLKIKINKSVGNGHNTVSHHSIIELKSHSINSLMKEDYDTVISIILNFIKTLQYFKEVGQ